MAQAAHPRIPDHAGGALAGTLAMRAGRRLLTAVEAAAAGSNGPSVAASAATHGAARGGAPAAASAVIRAALAAQWAMPVTGRSAPPGLLRRLVVLGESVTRAGNAAPAGGDHVPPAFAPALAAGDPAGRTRRTPGTGSSATGFTPAFAAGEPADRARPDDARRMHDSGRSSTTRADRVIPLPPPLESAAPEGPRAPLRALAADVPARGLGAATEAAERLRLPAAQDGPPGDDLDALAANVKRILDQEARRHGIDV
jgi:hypothetical protein